MTLFVMVAPSDGICIPGMGGGECSAHWPYTCVNVEMFHSDLE